MPALGASIHAFSCGATRTRRVGSGSQLAPAPIPIVGRKRSAFRRRAAQPGTDRGRATGGMRCAFRPTVPHPPISPAIAARRSAMPRPVSLDVVDDRVQRRRMGAGDRRRLRLLAAPAPPASARRPWSARSGTAPPRGPAAPSPRVGLLHLDARIQQQHHAAQASGGRAGSRTSGPASPAFTSFGACA